MSPKSLENLSKGRTKGHGRNRNFDATGGEANTFRALLEAVGSLDLSPELWAKLAAMGITKEWCRAHGITQYRKLAKVVTMYLDDTPAMAREIMDRLEGKIADKSEITGKDGGPIKTEDVSLTDGERAARLAAIFDRIRTRRDRQTAGNSGGVAGDMPT
jgi:hypothetical protein